MKRHLKEEGKIDIEEKFIESLESYDEKERHESNVIEMSEFHMFVTCGEDSIRNSEHAQKPPYCGMSMPQVFDLWFLTKENITPMEQRFQLIIKKKLKKV